MELLNQGLYCRNTVFVNIMGNLSHKWPRSCSVCRNYNLTLSLLMTYHWVCNKSNTRGTTGGTETAILAEHMSPAPVFARSVGFYIEFAHHCVSFCLFPFGHCIVSSSSVDDFWLPRCCLQAFLPMSCGVVFVCGHFSLC